MDHQQLISNMTHHKPDSAAQEAIETLREAYKRAAEVLAAETPDGRASSLAQTKLEESLMWAVKAVVVPGG